MKKLLLIAALVAAFFVPALAHAGTKCSAVSSGATILTTDLVCGVRGGLDVGVTGFGSVPGGGTGLTTLTAHSLQVGNGVSAITQLGVGATGTLLTGVTGADPAFSATPTLGANGGTGGSIVLKGSTSGSVTLDVYAAAGTATLFRFPNTNGSAGQVLITDSTGQTSWSSPSAGSGTVNAGTAGQLGYYATSSSAMSGNANLTVSSGALTIGVGGSQAGTLKLSGGTSGTTTLAVAAVAVGTLTLPAATDTLVGKATTDTLTNKTYDTAGTGNSFKINGTAITAVTGTGAAMLAASPTTTGTFTAVTITASGAVTGTNFVPSNSTVPTNGLYLPAANTLGWGVNSAAELQLTATGLSPAVTGGNSLGTSSLMWAGEFLSSGAVISFNNGDATITHSAGLLTANVPMTATSFAASGTGADTLPVGTTAQRPTGANGKTRFNSTLLAPETYFNSNWQQQNMTPVANGLVYNPANNPLTKIRTGIGNVRAASANSIWYWIGASTVDGFCTKYVNLWERTNTMEYLMAKRLTNQYGVNANDNAIFGYTANEDTLYGRNTDTRITVNAGWAENTVKTLGGFMLQNSTNTNAIDYVPDPTSDTMVLLYPKDTVTFTGTISWTLDGGSATNIVENATAALGSTSISLGTPGVHVVHVKRVSGTVGFIGQYNYLSTTPSVIIVNMGIGSQVAAFFTGAGGKPYETPAVWNNLAHDATFIQLGNSDAYGATADATYKQNLADIANGNNGGDVIFIAQEPYGAAAGTVGNLAAKITDMRFEANALSLPMIDQTLRIVGYDPSATAPNTVSGLGYSCGDGGGVHANVAGYVDQERFLTSQILTLAGTEPLYAEDPIAPNNNDITNYNYTPPNGDYMIGDSTTPNIRGFSTASTEAGSIDASQQWTLGPRTNATAQTPLSVNQLAPTTNGTSRFTIFSRDTGAIATGMGGGLAMGYTDSDGTPRTAGVIWSYKINSTNLNTSNGVKIGSRFNTESVSTGITLDDKQHVMFGNTAPALATGAGDCGTSPSLSADATDVSGTITVGSSTNGGKCTLTFAHSGYTVAPHCFCQNQTTANILRPPSTTTTLACTGTLVAADKISYWCPGL